MSILNPDDWIVLNVKYGKEQNAEENRIMMTWRGDYLNSQTWRLSTDITAIEEESDRYLAKVGSGKTYVLLKSAVGRSAYMNDILYVWLNDPSNKIEEININIVKEKL